MFDLGGVLIDIDFDEVFRSWEKHSSLSMEDIRCRFSMDAAYQRHERGEIDATEYFDYLRDLLELDGSDEEITRAWNSIFVGEITSSMNVVNSAKRHLPCYVFTNSNPTHQAHWEASYPEVVRAFDRIFVSSELGIRKPDPDAFSTVAEAIGVSPGAILFFDDTDENIAGAREAGMQTVLVQTPSDIKQALVRIGVL